MNAKRLLLLVIVAAGCDRDGPAPTFEAPRRAPTAARRATAAAPVPDLWWQLLPEGEMPRAIPCETDPSRTPGSLFYGAPLVVGPYQGPPPGWYSFPYYGPDAVSIQGFDVCQGYPQKNQNGRAVARDGIAGAFPSRDEAVRWASRHNEPGAG